MTRYKFLPDYKELVKFLEIMKNTAPENYTPWLFPIQKNNKAPDVPKNTSWKSKRNLLNPREAIRRLKDKRGNVGIAARNNDKLVPVDIDTPKIEDELKPTLKIRSRSRTGTHGIYWADPEDDILPTNIPTDKGEVRASNEYVVAPGSYVPCPERDLNNKIKGGEITEKQKEQAMKDPKRGLYTIANDKNINEINFEELPKVFKKTYRQNQRKKQEIEKIRAQKQYFNPKKTDNDHSALFDLEMRDLIDYKLDERNPHPLHPSDTGKNFSISSKTGLAHCWRHLVSLNPIQYLCIKSGYLRCEQAGTGHKNAQDRMSTGPSYVIGDNQAIWEAWLYAKNNHIIPKDDPVPLRAMYHIADKHKVVNESKHEWKLDPEAYNRVLEIIEEEY